MTDGELLTNLTIWLSLLGYTASAAILLTSSREPHRLKAARGASTFGCALLLAHIGCAFHFHHGWSHTAAYLDTARQTAQIARMNFGGGVFVNYLFALAWLGDLLWWWLSPASYQSRRRMVTAMWHGFVIFMTFNATVVFGSGPARWTGLVICSGLCLLWLRKRRLDSAKPPALTTASPLEPRDEK